MYLVRGEGARAVNTSQVRSTRRNAGGFSESALNTNAINKKQPALTNAGFGEDTVLGGSGKPKLLDVLLYRAL
jgi:hypothetical protein